MHLQNLPYELRIHEEIESEYFQTVKNFAKETGDLKTLSYTDMRVIALGLALTAEKGEYDRVKKTPKSLSEFRPKQFEEDYKRIEENDNESDDSESDDEDQSSQEEDERPEKKQRGRKNPAEGVGFDDF